MFCIQAIRILARISTMGIMGAFFINLSGIKMKLYVFKEGFRFLKIFRSFFEECKIPLCVCRVGWALVPLSAHRIQHLGFIYEGRLSLSPPRPSSRRHHHNPRPTTLSLKLSQYICSKHGISPKQKIRKNFE